MLRATRFLVFGLSVLILACSSSRVNAQTQLPGDTQQKIDKVATEALAKTGVPSASIAVVANGKIAYLHAYGNARLNPERHAMPEMRYSIGSISKQFTAAAILFLQEEGKLSLDDKIAKFISNLAHANEVTIRPTSLADIGLPGLCAAGLRHAEDAAARYTTEDSISLWISNQARNGSTATRIT